MTERIKIKRNADYEVETGKRIPRLEALMMAELREEIKELKDYIVADVLLKHQMKKKTKNEVCSIPGSVKDEKNKLKDIK